MKIKEFFLGILLIFLVACATWTPAPPQNDYHDQVNYYRWLAGRPAVMYEYDLQNMAQDHANWMCASGQFVHRDLYAALYEYGGFTGLGEVMIKGDVPSFNQALGYWDKSPGHKSTILGPFSLMGVGHAWCGYDIWVMNLGTR